MITLCFECLQEVYNRKQTLVRETQWLFYEPHSICCCIKSWQIIHFFVEPGAKVNGAYYCEKLLVSMIPEMDRLTGY